MDYLWGGMLLIGIVYGAFTGRMQEITDAVLNSSREAVTLGISMAGVMALWLGLMEIAKNTGLIERMTKAIRPVVRFLFPKIPKGHPAEGLISTNMIANLLGLGMAATPAGLKAMESLAELEKERGRKEGIASHEMCTFLILNIASLQLIPVNMIAYRSQYGSVNPAAIVGPGMVETAVSALVAAVYCKWKGREKER